MPRAAPVTTATLPASGDRGQSPVGHWPRRRRGRPGRRRRPTGRRGRTARADSPRPRRARSRPTRFAVAPARSSLPSGAHDARPAPAGSAASRCRRHRAPGRPRTAPGRTAAAALQRPAPGRHGPRRGRPVAAAAWRRGRPRAACARRRVLAAMLSAPRREHRGRWRPSSVADRPARQPGPGRRAIAGAAHRREAGRRARRQTRAGGADQSLTARPTR